jgi:hypothetical protein
VEGTRDRENELEHDSILRAQVEAGLVTHQRNPLHDYQCCDLKTATSSASPSKSSSAESEGSLKRDRTARVQEEAGLLPRQRYLLPGDFKSCDVRERVKASSCSSSSSSSKSRSNSSFKQRVEDAKEREEELSF